MGFKNFPSPHCHQQSLDSASTPEAFADKELELGTSTLTVTDHGSMAGCREVYDLAKKKGLNPVLGLEGYFRDDECPILKGFDIRGPEVKEYFKYGHLTLHYLDQEAYETGCRILSEADTRAERHGQELKPLFNWKNLEELGSKNIVFTSSCLAGMVQRHLLADRPDIATAYYEKMRAIVKPGNFYVEVFPHRCDRYWVNGVFLTIDGIKDQIRYWGGKNLKILLEGKEQNIKAEDLAVLFSRKEKPSVTLLGRKDGRAWIIEDQQRILKDVQKTEDFLPNECRPWCPDGDVQAGANRFLIWLAQKHGDPILISDDSHYVHKDEQKVQDVRLMAGGGSWRFYGSYHRLSSDEAWEYFKSFGIKDKTFESWIENNAQWAARFKGFEFKTRKSLPTKFYPQDTLGHIFKLIQKHGRMNWKDKAMTERLQSEIDLLHKNGTIDLLPYFMIDEEVCDLYSTNGQLTGPGRGSAAGLLLTYLLGITHVDPLRYKLSRDRFMTLDRVQSGKLPDIDQDVCDRDLLIGGEYSGFEVTMEDGSVKRVRTETRVMTSNGEMAIEEAFRKNLDVEWP